MLSVTLENFIEVVCYSYVPFFSFIDVIFSVPQTHQIALTTFPVSIRFKVMKVRLCSAPGTQDETHIWPTILCCSESGRERRSVQNTLFTKHFSQWWHFVFLSVIQCENSLWKWHIWTQGVRCLHQGIQLSQFPCVQLGPADHCEHHSPECAGLCDLLTCHLHTQQHW